MSIVALSELIGATVRDASGTAAGRVREVAVTPQDHPPASRSWSCARRLATARSRPTRSKSCSATAVRASTDAGAWERYTPSDGVLLLKRDLLDQQIIDVHGRKVVRVNDVEIDSTPINEPRPPERRLGRRRARAAPCAALPRASSPPSRFGRSSRRFRRRVIPWQYVDLLETDPARRVKLKIAVRGPLAAPPGRHCRHRGRPARRPSAKPCSRRSTRKWRLRRSRRSIPTSRCRSSSRSIPPAPPTSSRRWTPTRRPTCSAI